MEVLNMKYVRETWCPTCYWSNSEELEINDEGVRVNLKCPAHSDVPDTLIVLAEYPVLEGSSTATKYSAAE